MTRYLSLVEVLNLHRQIIEQSGGAIGVRDLGSLESAIAQPRMTFGGKNLYPMVIDKAVALGFSIIMNHPFIDGNKRTGHAAMETFMILNGTEISADVDEQEQIILAVASGNLGRDALVEWLRLHTTG
ncbi:type II toxin-antitoxin system death-on-curing family toxin [Nostoc sp. LEGE 06077]|uniref:type II toxin-antitoxin system death-on-curing family toxin n=1 Tax=Nostoc sp. LEGE 06077 TaxID=915325 RepID=UPI0018819E4F|nr:type II toxin-antitoxin system death-on-curing family toxin [Nostoc sp. LEGE 06077]MBE9205122.1 type II toxin-antitoxin system death-on-curing family toxin [Nostoc sp. LEGE 06077]